MIEKFDIFYFEKFEFSLEKLEAKFYYSFDKKENFIEKIDFLNLDFKLRDKLDLEIINSLLFHLHIALGISYYKLFPTKKLVLETGFLDENQVIFWKNFYLNGLGEFFLKNNIDPNGLINFLFNSNKIFKLQKFNSEKKALLLWGGGKDSIVSYSLIKDKIDFSPFIYGKLDDIKKNTLKILNKDVLNVEKKLDENLFRLNEKGYYNGHIPITGIISFIATIICYLYNYTYTILSNEKSSSEENTVWKGLKINHQYSKSFDFEKDFSSYLKNYINPNLSYFSLLRGMYEYKIAQIFSKQTKFFPYFSSCNRNFKLNSKFEFENKNWCCNCEKCAFVFLILSNFLDIKKLKNIFGSNLLENNNLLLTFKSLVGFLDNKPFECVGTYEESFLSLYNLVLEYKNKKEKYYILKELENKVLYESKKIDLKKIEEKLLKISEDDIISKEIKDKINLNE